MIVWSGGDQKSGNLSSGGRYDPAKDTWVAMPEAGAPSGRGIIPKAPRHAAGNRALTPIAGP